MAARILIIEDNATNMELMSYLLEAQGHTVTQANDGEQGLALARTTLPELIICDLQLPRMDGYEIARQLKHDRKTAVIPIVAVTAYAMVGDREKALAAGFDSYISKPIDPEIFGPQVAECLSRPLDPQPKSIESARRSEPLPAPRQKRPLQILVVDNSPANRHLAHSMLEPFGYEVVCAQDVQSALELARRHPPHLILSDIHMPGEDGYDFIRRVKADERLRTLPFVFISSTVRGVQDIALALSAGADKFLLRPIEPAALVAELKECLETHTLEIVSGHDPCCR